MSRIYLSTVIVAFSIGSAYAGKPEALDFSTLDADKDGYISDKEAAISVDVSAFFPELDTNQDNLLSVEEFSKFRKHVN